MTRPRSILWLGMAALAAVVAGALGCGSARTIGGAPAGSAVTLSRDVQPIFDANCAVTGCHAGSSPQQGMNLSAGQAAASIINVPSMEDPNLMRVKPGDSANSYLYLKVSATQTNPPPVGDAMPPDAGLAAVSSPEDVDTIRRWIDGGALP